MTTLYEMCSEVLEAKSGDEILSFTQALLSVLPVDPDVIEFVTEFVVEARGGLPADESWRTMSTEQLEQATLYMCTDLELYGDVEAELERRAETDERVQQANGDWIDKEGTP